MKKLIALVALIALSLLLFVAVFSIVHRPLVVGEIQNNLDFKLAYARTLPSPKLVIFAGSNGRYSHRCEQFTAVLGRPCVNASIGVGIGLDFLIAQWRPLLRPGDTVYMPLEYTQYRFTRDEMNGGLQNALLVHNHPDHLRTLGPARVLAAYGSFDLPFLIHGITEMALAQRGFRRRSSTDSLTPQGDERGHSADAGRAYREFLASARPGSADIPQTSDAIRVIGDFLSNARRDGVHVVGGLPTVPDTVPVDPRGIERLRGLYEAHGQSFLVIPNLSRYPLDCFFDTLYHLNEACQRAHSSLIATVLKTEEDRVPRTAP